MQSSTPWQDILDAKQVTLSDLAAYHKAVAQSLTELGPVRAVELKAAHSEIENSHRKRMMAAVQTRSEEMMTSERISQIAAFLVDDLTSNKVLWHEVLYDQHQNHFRGQSPSRDKLSLSWVDAIQRDYHKAQTFDPYADTNEQITSTLFSAKQLPKSEKLTSQIEDLLWQRIEDTTNPAPLPSRVPDIPAVRAVYIEGVKLVYKLVKRSLGTHESRPNSVARETYSHNFMSAGEAAFGVLNCLGIIMDVDGPSYPVRYCNAPPTAVFVHPLDAVEGLIDQHADTAPSLGHVLCAVSYMSSQFGRGFNLQITPAKVDETAQEFISASQAAGLCARLDEDFAFWLPFCDDDVLSLYRFIDSSHYADDLLTPEQQTSQLIRAKMAEELAQLPKEVDFRTLHAKLIKPWEVCQKQIGWLFRPHHKGAETFWIAVARALGIDAHPRKSLFPKA